MAATIVFAASTFAATFWTLGFFLEGLMQSEPSPILAAVIAGAVAWALTFGARHYRPGFLSFEGTGLTVLARCVLWSLAAYLLTLPVGLLLGFGYLVLLGRETPSGWDGETQVFLAISALWFPLWWAPALGVAAAWVKQKRGDAHSASAL